MLISPARRIRPLNTRRYCNTNGRSNVNAASSYMQLNAISLRTNDGVHAKQARQLLLTNRLDRRRNHRLNSHQARTITFESHSRLVRLDQIRNIMHPTRTRSTLRIITNRARQTTLARSRYNGSQINILMLIRRGHIMAIVRLKVNRHPRLRMTVIQRTRQHDIRGLNAFDLTFTATAKPLARAR